MRWTGSGKIKKKDKTILYSGPEELHQKGVGIILNKETGKALIGQKLVNDRITTVRFQSRHAKTNVVVIYAPTEEAEEEEKDNFYDQCQDVFNEIPKHDMVLLLGDMNAQVDSNRQGLEHIIGPHVVHNKPMIMENNCLCSVTQMAYVLVIHTSNTN